MSTSPDPALGQWLAAARDEPERCGLFLDVDGTLAPVVERADDARVPTEVSRVIGRLSSRLALVACVSGRSAADAKRLVGVGGVVYAGAHGAELIDPTSGELERAPELAQWQGPIQDFIGTLDTSELRRTGIRLEDKSFIQALHWRGSRHDEEAELIVEHAAAEARKLGFEIHRGRKVLEIRPPIKFNKGIVVTRLAKDFGLRAAAYIGDDNTDADAFDALRQLRAQGSIDTALCVAALSDEVPTRLLEGADCKVDGPRGVAQLLQKI
jgi:trehalose 6-phosphate phosphatase